MRFIFDRVRYGRKMAEGIEVDAENLEEAIEKAMALNKTGDYGKSSRTNFDLSCEKLVFRDNASD